MRFFRGWGYSSLRAGNYRDLSVLVTTKILYACLLLSTPAFAQPVTEPATESIPKPELLALFKRELGDRYRDDQAENYLAAHRLAERYLTATVSEQRKGVVAAIEVLGVDPNIIGRISRIRSNWPALKPAGVYYINERMGPLDVHYFLGVPAEYTRDKAWPLVVKLPAADAFVSDPKPNADEVQRIYENWVSEEIKAHPDALVIMPLLSLDDLWGPSYAGMNSVIGPMLHVQDRANVDVSRVYLIGHSMSGHAAWNLPVHYPTYFTATNPLAGSMSNDWQRLRIMNLRNLLVVPWADSDDKVVKPTMTGQLVALLKRFKIDVDFVETKGVGHIPTPAIAEQCYAKLRARKRDLYPHQIALQSNRPETIFNRIDWLQIYQPTDPGDEKKLFFNKKPGNMVLMANTWNAQATLNENRIELTTGNVEILRVYVNDQMIDFAKPVTVAVNKRVRFQGLVKPSVDTMLKDQIFLGRGWRYYTAAIDIDLSPPPTTKPATRAGL